MKNFFTLILIFCLNSAWATNYYFSATSGDDNRNATQAENPSTPWKTLNKLNAYFNRLKPGDAVLLKRGETFYGSIHITKSGTPSSPIVIGAYGTGSKPVITSLVNLNNWVSKGNGIWESYNPSLATSVQFVLVNGVQQQLGRYPNADATNKGYLNFESHAGKNSITDYELTSAVNWTGAEIVIRCNRWIMDRNPITSHSGNTIHFRPSSGYSPSDHFGYFIQNNIKTLDKFGEWYYNPSNKKLSVYFGSNSPSSLSVQATTIDNLVNSHKFSNIVFTDLNIKGANSCGIYIKYGFNIRVSNCDVIFSGYNGIAAYYSPKFTIENSTIVNSNNDGIDLGYGGDFATIRNNKVLNSSVIPGMGESGDGKGMAIHCNGNNTLIEHNEIINTGYTGINFNGNSTIVKNNYVDSFCLTKDDGGGIYTYTGSSKVKNHGRKIVGNIVLNGIGVPQGTDGATSAAEGIYLDNNTSQVEIRDNTVANCTDNGIYLHDANNITITNNTVYNNFRQILANQDGGKNNFPIRNCIITDNNLFSKYPTQSIVNLRSFANDINLFAKFDSNYYNRPFADWFIISNNFYNNSGQSVKQRFNLEEWKTAYNKDLASKRAAKLVAPFKINRLTGENKFANGTFTTSARGIYPSSCVTTLSNGGQMNGGYLEVKPSRNPSSVFVNIGELKAGAKYILRFSAKGSDNSTMYLASSLRKAGTPYTILTPVQYSKVGFAVSNNEIAFSSPVNVPSAQIVLSIDTDNKYYLDNIEFYEADAEITNIDDSLRFVYNPTSVSKTVSLNGDYADVKNNRFSNSITLQPFHSAILIKVASVQNVVSDIAPTVALTSPKVNAEYKASATIQINAEAADQDGSVKKVEFYNGANLLFTATEAPYYYTWKNVFAGNYTLTAKATDNKGNVATSKSVNISVTAPMSTANQGPKVNITSPEINASYNASADITVTANASDADGSIKKVEIYSGTTLINTQRFWPYTFVWNNVPAGKYTITAKATDNSGNVTISESVSLNVTASSQAERNAAPKVNITSPNIHRKYKASATINISANATDEDGKVKRVEFYNGKTLLHVETGRPYSWDWRNVRAGSYTITAVAIDDKGAETKSESVTVTVDSRKIGHRGTVDNDTLVATDNTSDLIEDTTEVAKNAHAVALKRDEFSPIMAKTYEVKLFPNPAVGKIQISVDDLQLNNQKAILTITNLAGIIVKNVPVMLSAKTLEADVTSLTSGMYILSIKGDNLVISKKFIKG